jgi:acyl-CoA dehydrogenase
MTYRAPVADIAFTMRHVAGLDRAIAEGVYGDLSAPISWTRSWRRRAASPTT